MYGMERLNGLAYTSILPTIKTLVIYHLPLPALPRREFKKESARLKVGRFVFQNGYNYFSKERKQMRFKTKLLGVVTILFALASASCGSASNNSIIATSVAQTVQAQNTQTASVAETPLPLATIPPLSTNTFAPNTSVVGSSIVSPSTVVSTLTPLAT